jgi:two-component system OmpR family response regulator
MPKALVVEDEKETGFMLAELLRRRGYTTEVLHEGKPVLDWAREHGPDVIFLDLLLPDMDGFTVCEGLKLDRVTNLIPVIMATALDDPKHRVHGFKVGANHYLTKPFTQAEFDQAVAEVTRWRENLVQSGARGEVQFHLQSNTEYLDALNRLLSSLFLHSGLSEAQAKQLTMAVREMGSNAIEWGHKKQVNRLVAITYRMDVEKVTVMIQDTGPGFDRRNLPHAAQAEDPCRHMEVRGELGIRDGGFGILMTNGLVDDMQYNESGNEVRLVKYIVPRPPQS